MPHQARDDGDEDAAAEEEEEEQEAEGAEVSFVKKPILVLWEARSRALFCLMLPAKALADTYAVRTVVRLQRDFASSLTLRTPQGPT